MKKHLLCASLLLSSAISYGAGFQLNLQGLRQLAMGGTGTAAPWDASAIFYNPGAMSNLKGNLQISASGLLIIPKVEYAQSPSGSYTAFSKSQTFTPFNIYVSGKLNFLEGLSVGVGVYTPFGSGLKWDDDWAGRYLVQDIKLTSIFIQPTVSYRINDVVSVGAGFIYAFGHLDLNKAIPVTSATNADGQAQLTGNASGIGFNAGVHIKANDMLQFGVTYRSEVKMKVKTGDATFTVPTSLESNFPTTTFATQLPLPQVLSFGVSVKPISKLTLQFDVNYIGWSSYDSLNFDFADAHIANSHSPRNYKSTVAFRLGGSYAINKKFSVMAGGAIDPTPVADGLVSPELPDANHKVLTCGVAIRPVRSLTILAAIEYTTTSKRDAMYTVENFGGVYQTKAITPGIGINLTF